MFEIGQLIVYGSTGVCRIEAVETPANLPVADPARLYYRLKPLYDAGVIYTPVDTKVFMRPVISKEQAQQLIRGIPSVQAVPCDIHNPQMLSDHYKTFFQSHRCEDLVRLIKSLRAKMMRTGGKPVSKTDQHYLKRAQEALCNELAVALEMPADEVGPYIENAVEASEIRAAAAVQ